MGQNQIIKGVTTFFESLLLMKGVANFAFAWIGLVVFMLIVSPTIHSYVSAFPLISLSTLGEGVSSVDGETGDINVNTAIPTVSYAAVDKLSLGNSVTTTQLASKNGGAAATAPSSANADDSLQVLFVNNTAYHNALVTYTVVDGANTVDGELYGNASLSTTVFNTDYNSMTNGGGAVNQTVAAGGVYNLDVRFDGQELKSTNDMVCVLEGSNASKISSLKLVSGAELTKYGKSVTGIYSTGANSVLSAYEVPAITGASTVHYTLVASSVTGQSMAGANFKMSCMSKEYFLDATTGGFMYDIQDSLGTTKKSMNTYTFVGYFQ
jgi:hypothetical protein